MWIQNTSCSWLETILALNDLHCTILEMEKKIEPLQHALVISSFLQNSKLLLDASLYTYLGSLYIHMVVYFYTSFLDIVMTST